MIRKTKKYRQKKYLIPFEEMPSVETKDLERLLAMLLVNS